jgi:enhancing lycopene biosynthesis protein 2
LVLPGGFGVAKNFSNFATENDKFTVEKEVERVLKDFHQNKKQIAACCIAPILLGKAFAISNGGPGAKLTLGSEGV